MSAPEYADLYFGKGDPRHEVLDDRGEFLRSYVDLDGAVNSVINGRRMLILGPKGTGKTALGVYLELTGGASRDHVARLENASRLPLEQIPELASGTPSRGASRAYSAWKFVILANYLDTALKDPDAKVRNIREIRRVLAAIKRFGLIETGSGQKLLQIQGKRLEIDRSSLGALFKDAPDPLSLLSLVPYMEEWAYAIKSPRRHILLLDGLDSIFLNDPRYNESLAGLTQAVYDLDMELAERHSTGSVVLLLRNDIFARMSLLMPDAHKLRDFALDLDWRMLAGPSGETAPLFRLANAKASQQLQGEQISILDYYPAHIEVGDKRRRRGNHPGPKRMQYLLNLTRHTPRDLLQLFEYVRKSEMDFGGHSIPSKPLGSKIIREGVIQYSTKYFAGAIRNELAGYEGGVDESEAALRALKKLDKNQFTLSDYRRSLSAEGAGLQDKAELFLRMFFQAGALGNLFQNGSDRYLVFYHRRDDVELNAQGTLVLHNALNYAWSRGFGMRA